MENIVQLLSNLIALLLCLFQYISNKKQGWILATIFFLFGLMSCYYWTAFLIIMNDYPNVSNLFSYAGWNASFFVLLLLVLHMRSKGSKHYFHPLMLLPIPFNIWQLTIYLQYGGFFNNVYQVSVMTAIMCFSIQSICWYFKNKENGERPPYVAFVALMFACFEFGMWTCSCFDVPILNFYYPFSFLASSSYLFLVWALFKTYKSEESEVRESFEKKYQNILKGVYLLLVIVCCIGGILLGVWMRDTMDASLINPGENNIYDIIHVVLFIISLFIVAFAIAIIFVVNFSEKVYENNELREARMIAEHSNAAKSDFLANMSHEIRTPINTILGMNEMILRESLSGDNNSDKKKEELCQSLSDISVYSGNIKSAGNNLLSIINDILDISKIEAGKVDIIETDYKLSSVLNDVCNMIYLKAKEKNLDFRADVDNSLPDYLHGDDIRVRQIITNILNNAVKYTEKGTILLSVSGENINKDDKQIDLIVRVKDTGIGIREEDLDKLFQKFERVDLEKNSTVEGTGLGLAISHTLLEMMGGNIAVESEYGKGSTFTIRIPQKIVSEDQIGDFEIRFKTNVEETQTYEDSFVAPDAHILIVDDTKMNLAVADGLLKNTQIKIDMAGGGKEAIDLAKIKSYDLILMDQRMPEIDGTEALHEIRAKSESKNKTTPIICLTADAVNGAKERYIAEGFDDYLTKPINLRELEEMLVKYLPEEKVIPVQRDSLDKNSESTDDSYGSLAAFGIDYKTGLSYCQNDETLYRSLLGEFVQSSESKLKDLSIYYEEKDWKNYAIIVHSLKSTSKMIGADKLSEIASRLETAANEENEKGIMAEHSLMIDKYKETIKAISSLIPAPEISGSDEDWIMEFNPEDNKETDDV